MFLTEYILGGEMPGQATAVLDLSVDAPKKAETGKATVTWPVSPPVKFSTEVHGTYVETPSCIVSSILGQFPLAPGAYEFGATIVVPKFGEPGKGWFWWTDNKGRHEFGPVAAKPAAVPAAVSK